MPNLHDSGYKLLFSNRTIFRELLESFVDQPWIARLDFARAETIDKSFVSDHYKETESDLIYRLPLQHDASQASSEQELYIYVLLEFQSTVDPWMALRLLNYVTNFYMDWVAGHPRASRLPPVFPILLYNGDARWTAAQTMRELVESTLDLGEYGIGFRYFKIAENEYSVEQLLSIQNIVSTLFLAEARYDVDQLAEELLALFERAIEWPHATANMRTSGRCRCFSTGFGRRAMTCWRRSIGRVRRYRACWSQAGAVEGTSLARGTGAGVGARVGTGTIENCPRHA